MRAALALAALIPVFAGCTMPPRVDIALEPPRPVTDGEWKAVINDWYDGRIDNSHRCAAVREAIEHLPQDGGGDSFFEDLHTYERRVCD
jgi:hypothetical protein